MKNKFENACFETLLKVDTYLMSKKGSKKIRRNVKKLRNEVINLLTNDREYRLENSKGDTGK
jgi:formylmethanofuran dehydrogenase subunit A